MSTAGIYNARPAIINGTKPYLNNQMKSHQVPHYFGGSQVPINLHPHPNRKHSNHINGNGILSTIAKDVGKQLIRKHVLGEGLSEHVRGLDDDSRTEAEANIAEWNIQNDRKKRASERVREQNEKMEREQRERVRANDKFGSFSSMLNNRLPPASTAPTAPAPIQAPSTQRLSLLQPSGNGFFDEFMGGFSQGLDMMLGGRINDPQTYRKHTTGLSKAIGSNTYRTAKI